LSWDLYVNAVCMRDLLKVNYFTSDILWTVSLVVCDVLEKRFFASEMLTHQGTVLLKDLRKT